MTIENMIHCGNRLNAITHDTRATMLITVCNYSMKLILSMYYCIYRDMTVSYDFPG